MTPHFTDAELACECGCGMLPDRDFMSKVERMCVAWGKPMKVSSAARCQAHNAKVSATGATGPHTSGHAIDFDILGAEAVELCGLALRLGIFTGIGVNQKGAGRFLHFDDLPNAPGQPRPWIWSY